MTWVAAAVFGGAVLGAGASMGAANKQAGAAGNAAALQQQQYQQTRTDQEPWRQSGANALGMIGTGFGMAPQKNAYTFDPAAYLKANPDVAADPYWGQHPYEHFQQHGQGEGRQFTGVPDAGGDSSGVSSGMFTHQFSPEDLKAGLAPNYDWQLKTGTAAATNAATAAGFSGNAVTGAQDWAQNYAGNAYQNAFNNWNTQTTGIFNRLASIAGLGQTANNSTGTIGATLAGNQGGYMTSAGAAQAAGLVGASNAASSGIGNYLGWQYLNSKQTTKPYYGSDDNPSGAMGGP